MKKILQLIFNNSKLPGMVILISFALFSCGDDDPEPFPASVPKFRIEVDNGTIPEVGKTLHFINESINAAEYEWSFGAGQTSTEASPNIVFLDAGIVEVKLKTTTQDGQVDSVSQTIGIGQRQLVGMNVLDIGFEDAEDAPWDDADGPDVQILFSPQEQDTNDPKGFITGIVPNVGVDEEEVGTETALPFGYDFSSDPIILTNEPWDFVIFDDDGEGEDPQVMFNVGFNPVLVNLALVNEDGEGFIPLYLGNFEIELYFEIVVP